MRERTAASRLRDRLEGKGREFGERVRYWRIERGMSEEQLATRLAEQAVAVGVRRDGVLVDAAHDFGKNTFHSLEVTRRLDELVATGWPVLVAVSNKKFLGEVLDVDKDNRLEASLAATAICAWHGAQVFRAHQVLATTRVLDTVGAIRGTRPPAISRRALA